jgi:integrase
MAKRRGNQEGSIYKRKGGLWCVQVSLNNHRLTQYFKTRREAREWLTKILEQIQTGQSIESGRISLADFLGKWLDSARPSLRHKTWAQYHQICRDHILPSLGEVRIRDLRPDQIQGLYNSKIECNVSTNTVRILHAVLHRSLEQAVRWGMIDRNPAKAVIRPKPCRKEIQTLNSHQARQFLIAAQGSRYEALYYLAITTGLRAGELLGLKWDDLDWIKGHLHVQRQVQRVPGSGLALLEPKSAAGRRVVVLGQAMITKMNEHARKQDRLRTFAVERWQEHGMIFTSQTGTCLDHRNVYREFKEILRRAGLPDIRFHDLRHTAATLMLQEGIHPKIVQERLGHAQIYITMDTYSHVLPTMQDEAAKKMDELIALIQEVVKVVNPHDG